MKYFRSGRISSSKEQITREEMVEDIKKVHPNAAEKIVFDLEEAKMNIEVGNCLYSVRD